MMSNKTNWSLGLALACLLVAFTPSQAAVVPSAVNGLGQAIGTAAEGPVLVASRPARRGNARPVARRKAVANQRAIRHRPHARPGVVRRPVVVVRPWRPRPHYGRIIAGVALGTVIAVAIANAAPPPPSPELCWYWTNNAGTEGYWDYCR